MSIWSEYAQEKIWTKCGLKMRKQRVTQCGGVMVLLIMKCNDTSSWKRKIAASDDSDDDLSNLKKKKDRDEKVQKIVDDLKSKHGLKYTMLQLRIWAELISSGLYTNSSEPPCDNSMFQRAEGKQCTKKKADNDFTQVVVNTAIAITSALVYSKKLLANW